MELNENGVLAPGIYAGTFEEIGDTFVTGYPDSKTRKLIYDDFLKFIKAVSNKYHVHEVWIDGSFTTAKVNPNDIDLVIFLYVESFISIQSEWTNIRNQSFLDPYIAVAVCEDTKTKVEPEIYGDIVNKRNYWRGQFGYDRNDIPKGIVAIKEPEIENLVKGGDIQCL